MSNEKINQAFEALSMCMRGVPLANMGRTEEALKAFDSAIAIDPSLAVPWANKGFVLHLQGRYDEALGVYDNAIEKDPSCITAWNGRGYTLIMLGRQEEALDAFERATGINPAVAVVWNGKGNAFSELGKVKEAMDAYDVAVEIDGRFVQPWVGRTALLLNNPELAGYSARQSFCRAIYLKKFSQKFPLDAIQLAQFAWTFRLPLLARQLLAGLDDGAGVDRRFAAEIDAGCEKLDSVFKALDNDSGLPEAEKLLRGGIIHYRHGDPLVAFRCFDAVDSIDESSMAGQYYLLMTLKEVLEPFDEEMNFALRQAGGILDGIASAEKDQIYYAGEIFALAGKNREAEICLRHIAGYKPDHA